MSVSPSFSCQQCKQPILLDPSILDASPDSVQEKLAQLQSSVPPRSPPLIPAQRARLNTSPAAKSAWEGANFRAREKDEIRLLPATSSTPPMHRRVSSQSGGATSRREPNASGAGAESFVLLPGSVVGKIPKNTTHGTPSTRRKSVTTSSTGPSSARGGTSNLPSSSRAPVSALDVPATNSLHSTMRIFTFLSSSSELDHPLCADCTNTLIEKLERRLEETKRERDGYIAFERDVRKNRETIVAGAGDERKLELKISRLEAEFQRAMSELRQVEQEKVALESELAVLQEEEDALEEEEIAFWTERSRTQLLQTRSKDTLTSVTAALTHTQNELAALARANVYNDAFCIGHDGVFGTVNGLRLGRAPGVNVEWAEINAAWGQALLLLYTIARKVDFTFETYRLIPMGSFSKIERIQGDRGTYELYGSGDLNFNRMLHNRRFDFAMVAFLDCLRQLMEYVKLRDPSLEFPHTVVKDKIGDVSIKLQFSQEEVWTRAMRHVLLALKLLLKWATSG